MCCVFVVFVVVLVDLATPKIVVAVYSNFFFSFHNNPRLERERERERERKITVGVGLRRHEDPVRYVQRERRKGFTRTPTTIIQLVLWNYPSQYIRR